MLVYFGPPGVLKGQVVEEWETCSHSDLLALQFEHTFMVEIDKKKREHLLQFKPLLLFKDMAEIGRDFAETHDGEHAKVPKAWISWHWVGKIFDQLSCSSFPH